MLVGELQQHRTCAICGMQHGPFPLRLYPTLAVEAAQSHPLLRVLAVHVILQLLHSGRTSANGAGDNRKLRYSSLAQHHLGMRTTMKRNMRHTRRHCEKGD